MFEDTWRIELAAARLAAAYYSGFDTRDVNSDPLCRAIIECSVGERELGDLTERERTTYDLYTEMIAGVQPTYPAWVDGDDDDTVIVP